MMPYKKTPLIMANIKKETNFLIKIFKNIFKQHTQAKSIISLTKSFRKWWNMQLKLSELVTVFSMRKGLAITFNFWVLILWLIKTFNHGSFKSIPILVSNYHPHCWQESFLIWSKMCSDFHLIPYSHHHNIGQQIKNLFSVKILYRKTNLL